MSVIHSIPGRIRFSARSTGGVRLLKEKAGHILASADIKIFVSYNMRTRRGLLIFIPDERVTRVLSELVDLLACDLATMDPDTDESLPALHHPPAAQLNPFITIALKVVNHYATRMFMPPVLRPFWCIFKITPLVWAGLTSLGQGKLDVNVLDGAAILSALFMGDFNTAGTIHLLMDISETLEDWTTQRSRQDISGLFVQDKKPVWVMQKGEPVAIPHDSVAPGDLVVVRSGGKIPVDGVVADGLAMVNQSSMTGEPLAVEKKPGSEVFAGTILEEGRVIIHSEAVGDRTRFA
ncbi:MAG: hypothetical protein MI802_12865, partial [Desulfobacterales bacterium]|nr:hypothetical protein [Desulfobacterales bacterium]